MQINKHGSFYIRTGWPTKIVDAIKKDAFIFSPNNELQAVDDIGVGRVMIKAMRYWSTALGIAIETKNQTGVNQTLSPLGVIIAENDPFFQNVGTLWLMHRHLAKEKELATAWYWAFNELTTKTFTKDSFSSEFLSYLQKNGEKYAKNAVEKEFDCLKNTYVSDKAFDIEKILDEETVPFFAPLKLIRYIGDGKFEMHRSASKDIPLDIALYCIINDNRTQLQESKQLGVDLLLEGAGQIGKYMNLSYASLLEMLQQLENVSKISLVNNFGNRHIQIDQYDAESILTNYYQGIAR